MSTPLPLSQPGLVLGQSIVNNGNYPVQAGGYGSVSADAIGMIITTAYSATNVQGLLPAAGQTQYIEYDKALFSVIGENFGGKPSVSFDLPNLGGASVVGCLPNSGQVGIVQGTLGNSPLLSQTQLPFTLGGFSEPISNLQYAENLQYLIQVNGNYPEGSVGPSQVTVGTIYPFAGGYVPEGFMVCAGQSLSVEYFDLLFDIIGNNFGGDGETSFQLPNLVGAVAIGAGGQFDIGESVGSATSSLYPIRVPNTPGATSGEFPLSTYQPSLALNYIISTDGFTTSIDSQAPLIGQVTMYGGYRPPEGWMFCQGQQLQISAYPNLYKLIGTSFGGDGVNTFALPDLRDRTVIGSGEGYSIGQTVGQPTIYVTTDNLPDLVVPVPGLSLANDTGASGSDHITSDFSLNVSNIWPEAQLQYTTDGKTWVSNYTAHEGSNTLQVRQVDVLGQPSSASQVLSFVLDSSAPVAPSVNLEFGGLALRSANSPTASRGVPNTQDGLLSVSGLENGAVLSYSTDGGKTWSEHFEAHQGLNQVEVRQSDTAGNVSMASSALRFFLTDALTSPATTSTTNNANGGHDVTVEKAGVLASGLGTAAVDTLHYGLQHSVSLPNDIENITLSGLGAGNTVLANAFDNLIAITSGSWTVDGGLGKDTVRLDGSVNDYMIKQATVDGTPEVTVIGPNGKLVLEHVERLAFNDVILSETDAQPVRDLTAIYQAALGRGPDFSGLAFWQHQFDAGKSLVEVADALLNSPEYLGRVGSQPTTDFVSGLYHNLLQRDPDAVGLRYWIEQIDAHHATRGETLVNFLHSNEASVLVGVPGQVLALAP